MDQKDFADLYKRLNKVGFSVEQTSEGTFKAKQVIGTCDFCGEPKAVLVAKLIADPDQKVCLTCHNDSRIPSKD